MYAPKTKNTNEYYYEQLTCRRCSGDLTSGPRGGLICLVCNPTIYNRLFAIAHDDERHGEPVEARNEVRREYSEAASDFGSRRWRS